MALTKEQKELITEALGTEDAVQLAIAYLVRVGAGKKTERLQKDVRDFFREQVSPSVEELSLD